MFHFNNGYDRLDIFIVSTNEEVRLADKRKESKKFQIYANEIIYGFIKRNAIVLDKTQRVVH